MIFSPIVLFVYNRPWHTKQTIKALRKNALASESELFIYSDAAKNEEAKKSVDEVRKYIKTIDGFKKVTLIEREENFGLAASIIDGVTQVIDQYKKVIVLEDDLVTSSYFLTYMNEGLSTYQDKKDIFSITGFNYPHNVLPINRIYNKDTYLSHRCMSWSWATWSDRWALVDWDVKDFTQLKSNKGQISQFNKGGQDLFPMLQQQMTGQIDSWAIRFCYAHSINKAFCLYPVKSLVDNEGFDGSGVHCNNDQTNKLKNTTLNLGPIIFDPNIKINEDIVKKFYNIFKISKKQRIKNLIRRFI